MASSSTPDNPNDLSLLTVASEPGRSKLRFTCAEGMDELHQFGVWHEGGHHTIQGLPILKHLLYSFHGDVMVRYVCRADTPCTLFLTIKDGVPHQKFKEGTPPLDWQWLENSILPLSASSQPLVMINRLALR